MNNLVFFKVLLVTGGVLNGQILDSTEILTEGASQWIYSGPLPTPRKELRAATINNKLLVTGKTDLSSSSTYVLYIAICFRRIQ